MTPYISFILLTICIPIFFRKYGQLHNLKLPRRTRSFYRIQPYAAAIYKKEMSRGKNKYSTEICNTMIPESPLAPDDSTCWQWWDAFEDGKLIENPPSVQKGCDYEPCKAAVCACDEYCCNMAWDLSCRGYELEPGDESSNFFSAGCSAKNLCSFLFTA